VECVVPLWSANRKDIIKEQIELGFKAVIKVVEKKYLGEEFLGKIIDKDLLQKIEATGADACGENGEYHTFVVDGPLYKNPVAYSLGQTIDLGSYMGIDLI
jgi:uncharacterized protein (TIGR00290 family)